MMDSIFENPLNQKLLHYLESNPEGWKSADPNSIDIWKLGTHPDLIEYLWDTLGSKLPSQCQWVIYNRPVLVRFDTGVIFAYAGGTHTYGFRLPANVREEAIKLGAKSVIHYPEYANLAIPGSSFDIETFGPEWILGGFLKQEPTWCLDAFHFAVNPPQQ